MSMDEENNLIAPEISRRAIAKGIAWATPAVVVATSAPAFAASLRKDPGLNGWVMNSLNSHSRCRHTMRVSSNLSDTGPDGAPFGLYFYNVEDETATIRNARLIYWILGEQTNVSINVNPVKGSRGWKYAGSAGTTTKRDGYTYTGYTFEYIGGFDARSQPTAPDGIARVWLEHFDVTIKFTQETVGKSCRAVSYWTERYVEIDRDGPGGVRYGYEPFTFERRNGELGPYTGSRARSASTDDADAGSEQTGPRAS